MFALVLVSALSAFCQEPLAGPIPKTYFGLHVQHPSSAWPDAQFGALRLWDTGVSWAQIEPSQGKFDWRELDQWLIRAQDKKVELLYTFGRTPGWASSNPGLATCAYQRGQCAPPARIGDWEDFVRAIVTHASGRIHAWELWNEPNLEKFYAGDLKTLVDMSSRAAKIIKAVDPSALVVSPCPTFSSTYKVRPGQHGSDAFVWMEDYLSAGAADFLDVISYHGYPSRENVEQSTLQKIANMKKVMAKHDSGNKPLWDTEASWGRTSDLPDSDAQAGFVAYLYLLHWGAGVSRLYWYGWDYSPWGTLADPVLGATPAGTAYREVSAWMIGSALTKPCRAGPDQTWACDIQLADGTQKTVVWNNKSLIHRRAGAIRDLQGKSNHAGDTIVGKVPVMIEKAGERP